MGSSRRAVAALVLLIAAGAWGAYALLQMRLAAGDVYPAYSSLRADPLGTRALHDGLAGLPGFSVRRNHEPLYRLGEMTSATLMVLGANPAELRAMDLSSFDALQAAALSGGRLVISFAPVNQDPGESWRVRQKREDERPRARDSGRRIRGAADDSASTVARKAGRAEAGETSPTDRHTTAGLADLPSTVSLRDRWGVAPEYVGLSRDGDKFISETAYPTKEGGLASEAPWHSALVFELTNPAWRTVLKRAGKPVVVERRFGRGTVVLASDSYFLSNEALRDARRPELLAWIVGGNRSVVFEETCHGIGSSPGVMGFVRQFRLHGLIGGLLLVMALFVWQNATSLVPPPSEGTADGAVAGRDMASGFVNLLRRNIARANLTRVCAAEWEKAGGAGADAETTASVRQAVEDEERLPARKRDPVAAYRRISEIIRRRKAK